MRQKVYYSADELVTNLHTTGSQWMTENGVEYQGSYHEYITGEVYTQSTWKPTLSKKLVPILKPQDKKKISPGQYWYKINNKAATKAQYMAYKNKPGGDEPGKQTNDPNVSLAKQSGDKRK